MPTSDEEARTEASWTDYELKFYIGPKRDQIQAENLQAGYDFTPAVTILDEDFHDLDDEVVGIDFSEFTLGAVVIEPLAGSHQDYSFIGYTTKTMFKLGGLVRSQQDDLAQAGSVLYSGHEAGSTIAEMVEVTNRVLKCDVDYDERGGAAMWSAKVSGWNYNSVLLDNDNLFAAFIRQRPASGDPSAWTDWHIWFVGYIKTANITDDDGSGRSWKAEVEGISQYMESDDNPRHYGRKDLAEGATITVSSYLEDPWQEKDSGEFVGFPILDGDQMTDGELSTLWMSEGEPSSTAEDALDVLGLCINEIMLRPRLGYVTRDHQWIELFWKRSDGRSEKLKRYMLTNSQTEWESVEWPDEEVDGVIIHEGERGRTPKNNLVVLGSGAGPLGPGGTFAILTFNKFKFLERYPHHQAEHVVDMRPFIRGTFELNLQGDLLAICRFGHLTTDIIWWKDNDYPRPGWQLYAWCGSDSSVGTQYSDWTGDMVNVAETALPRGYTLKKTTCGLTTNMNQANHPNATLWTTSNHPTPGYHITGDPEWIQADLGEMGITLEYALEANQQGTIQVNKVPTGIPESGLIQIDAEIIRIVGRNDENNTLLIHPDPQLGRAQLGTSAVEHPIGSIVKAYENPTGVEYEAFTAPLISSVSWRRKTIMGAEGPDVPKNFDIYVSTFVDPIMRDSEDWDEPKGSGGWEDYWDIVCTARNNRYPHWVGSFTPVRARHVLIVIYDMTYGGRVKVNQLHIWSDEVDLAEAISEDEDEVVQATVAGMWSGTIIQDIITRSIGMPADSFIMEEEGRPILELQTTGGNTLQAIRDICRRTGCSVVFGLDETVTHRFNPLYPLAGLDSLEYEWNRSNTVDVRLVRPFRHGVSQVVVKAHDPRTEETWEARYPPEPLELGQEITRENWIFTSPTEAGLMAEFTFRQSNAPLSVVLEPVGPAEWVRPGMRCTIDWDMDEALSYLNQRNFVVMGVTWKLSFGGKDPSRKSWVTSVKLTELIF